jgi:hypothetical protein
MNWLIRLLLKEARTRKFRPGDKVRFLTNPRKGTGRGIVLMPDFAKGEVLDYDSTNRSYRIRSDEGELSVHPRNIVPESFSKSAPMPPPTPIAAPVPEAPMVEPFPR